MEHYLPNAAITIDPQTPLRIFSPSNTVNTNMAYGTIKELTSGSPAIAISPKPTIVYVSNNIFDYAENVLELMLNYPADIDELDITPLLEDAANATSMATVTLNDWNILVVTVPNVTSIDLLAILTHVQATLGATPVALVVNDIELTDAAECQGLVNFNLTNDVSLVSFTTTQVGKLFNTLTQNVIVGSHLLLEQPSPLDLSMDAEDVYGISYNHGTNDTTMLKYIGGVSINSCIPVYLN